MTLNHVIPDALPAAERLAYRLNVYNAFTIALINLRGERQSIRNINKRFGVTLKSSWAERAVRAGGRVLSVDDVEHGIVRPQFKDPRVHMALVCAAKGCPPLRSGAYVADQIDGQLDDQARRFLAQESRNFVSVHTAVVHGSPIFTWYKADFGSDYAAVGAFWARYVPDERASSGQYAIRRLTDEKKLIATFRLEFLCPKHGFVTKARPSSGCSNSDHDVGRERLLPHMVTWAKGVSVKRDLT